jgi:O-antigen/teichoic acid export membrane protein
MGPLTSALIQLGSVPILLHAWGAPKYGDWLVLSAIPSYLALSDLGFGTASGSDMTVRVAGGDREGALRTFQSSWLLVTLICAIPLALASLVVWRVPWSRWLNLSTVSTQDAATVVLLLAAYVLVGQQTNVFESGYRAGGNFATGMSTAAVFRLLEAVFATIAGVVNGHLVVVALVLLATRTFCALLYLLNLLRKSPWIRIGFRHANMRTIRQLARPSLAFMALPAGQALSIQGFTILIASQLGSVAVVAFSTARTETRVAFQFFNIISIALWPELSAAFGAKKIALARELHRQACRASVTLSVLCVTGLWLAGPFLYRLWTRNAVQLDTRCFHLLLIVVVANSFWYTSSVVPMSTNAHVRLAGWYLVGAAISLGLAWLLLKPLGIAGAALALLVIDIGMSWLVLPTALRQVEDTSAAFWTAVLPWSRKVAA